jgi:hypothetical protein
MPLNYLEVLSGIFIFKLLAESARKMIRETKSKL